MDDDDSNDNSDSSFVDVYFEPLERNGTSPDQYMFHLPLPQADFEDSDSEGPTANINNMARNDLRDEFFAIDYREPRTPRIRRTRYRDLIPTDPDPNDNLDQDDQNVENLGVNNMEEDTFNYDLFNYDIGLPLEHGYLGQLNSLQSGRIIFPDGAKLKLPLVYLNGIILVPGQEIPFTFHHRALLDFFRRIVDSESKTFGIGYDNKYGTTAEVRSYNFTDDEVNIRAEGRQRFEISRKSQQIHEIYNARVVILPDINLGNYFGPIRTMEHGFAYRPKELTGLTGFPEMVYRQFDDFSLVRRIRAKLEKIMEQHTKNESFAYPEDPTAFSYFVLTCIPFPDKMKSQLLQLNCTTKRLRLLHALLKVPFMVQCAHCGLPLCKKQDFLVMSKRGTGGTFVNPSGVVHELFTFSRVKNVQSVSEWSDQFSWFPNYGWIITRCGGCMLHLGWKFVTKKKNIYPKLFWGITRTAIKISFSNISEENYAYKFVHDPTQIDTSHWNPNFE